MSYRAQGPAALRGMHPLRAGSATATYATPLCFLWPVSLGGTPDYATIIEAHHVKVQCRMRTLSAAIADS